MSQKESLVKVVLEYGAGEDRMRMHYEITREAYRRANELISREKSPISHNRRTELFFQAMEEYPVPEE